MTGWWGLCLPGYVLSRLAGLRLPGRGGLGLALRVSWLGCAPVLLAGCRRLEALTWLVGLGRPVGGLLGCLLLRCPARRPLRFPAGGLQGARSGCPRALRRGLHGGGLPSLRAGGPLLLG
ncbi:MAG: hypothetical protein N2047_08005 [Meiothermus sp.]|nr:hypothetical protein [Meiothermus sp.]